MRARMKDLVRTRSGEVVTLAELADRGHVTFSKSGNMHGRTGTAYFADYCGPDAEPGDCWEIGRLAYESRTRGAATL